MKKMTGIEMSARKKTCWLGSVLCYHFRFFKKAISYLFFLYNSLLIFLNMQRNLEGKKKIQTTNSLVYGQCISWQGLYFYYSKRTMLRNVGELEKKMNHLAWLILVVQFTAKYLQGLHTLFWHFGVIITVKLSQVHLISTGN